MQLNQLTMCFGITFVSRYHPHVNSKHWLFTFHSWHWETQQTRNFREASQTANAVGCSVPKTSCFSTEVIPQVPFMAATESSQAIRVRKLYGTAFSNQETLLSFNAVYLILKHYRRTGFNCENNMQTASFSRVPKLLIRKLILLIAHPYCNLRRRNY